MAITITSHKHKAFSALVIEPLVKFASRFSPKVLQQTFQCRVRILTSETSWPDMASQAKFPTALPLSHYIVNVRLIQWSKTFHLANESATANHTVPSPRSAYPTLTPSAPQKQLIKALTAVAPFSQSLHSLKYSSMEGGVSPLLPSDFTAELLKRPWQQNNI